MKRREEVNNKVAFVVEVCCKAKRIVAKRKEVPRTTNESTIPRGGRRSIQKG